ncbi:unnamed protein product [Adineta ricciae]|uniref:Uncharacterized protein n=1 Tax=Adineta ricciae TaxID=249248 RepID=A0A814TIR8_ADIRI|nr:unnamed protein product [Adineta ricciae]CAF1161978.1 unnamed protein product [Adineta ricciae]
MRIHRRDRTYWRSVLGILESLIMACLLFGLICALIASNLWTEQANWLSQVCSDSTSNTYCCNFTSNFFKFFSASTVKIASITIFASCLFIIIVFYLTHTFLGLRKRKTWKIITRLIAAIFTLLFLSILAISISAIYRESQFGNQYTSTSSSRVQIGAAYAMASLGLIAASLLLIDIICRLLTIGSVQKRQRRRKRRVNVIS